MVAGKKIGMNRLSFGNNEWCDVPASVANAFDGKDITVSFDDENDNRYPSVEFNGIVIAVEDDRYIISSGGVLSCLNLTKRIDEGSCIRFRIVPQQRSRKGK